MKPKHKIFILLFCLTIVFHSPVNSTLAKEVSNLVHDKLISQVNSSPIDELTIPEPIDDLTTPEPKEEESKTRILLTSREIALSAAVLLFGVLVISFEFILIKGLGDKINAQDFLNLFTTTLIIVGTLFLISSGIEATQIAPALGLYGTIIGYLLGREAGKEVEKKNKIKEE